MLLKLKSELSLESPDICPTCWTVRAEFLRSVVANYPAILSVLVVEYRGNAEATASVRGVHAVTVKFSFLFGIVLAEKVFSMTDRLSKALQGRCMFCK